jgi:hypothetical protein
LIFPKLAKVGWITLVIYTEVIIIMQFIWQLPFITDIAISTGKTWGFFISSDLWTLLRFHLVILIFTVIQQNTYEIINRKEKQRRYNQNNAENMTITTAPLEFGLQSFRIFQISKKLYLVVACYLIFSLIGFLGTVTLFKLGFV